MSLFSLEWERVVVVGLRESIESLRCFVATLEDHGPTAPWNLNRICNHHHDLKTRGNLHIEGDGLHKRLVPGPRTPPGYLPP